MDGKDLLAPFRFRLDPKAATAGDDGEETIAPGNAYAVARGTRNPLLLRFIRRNRKSFSLPYSFLSGVWFEPPGLAIVEYATLFAVHLTGDDLTELEARIGEQRVTWIRECSKQDAASLPVAVTRIRRLRALPSHDDDDLDDE